MTQAIVPEWKLSLYRDDPNGQVEKGWGQTSRAQRLTVKAGSTEGTSGSRIGYLT